LGVHWHFVDDVLYCNAIISININLFQIMSTDATL